MRAVHTATLLAGVLPCCFAENVCILANKLRDFAAEYPLPGAGAVFRKRVDFTQPVVRGQRPDRSFWLQIPLRSGDILEVQEAKDKAKKQWTQAVAPMRGIPDMLTPGCAFAKDQREYCLTVAAVQAGPGGLIKNTPNEWASALENVKWAEGGAIEFAATVTVINLGLKDGEEDPKKRIERNKRVRGTLPADGKIRIRMQSRTSKHGVILVVAREALDLDKMSTNCYRG